MRQISLSLITRVHIVSNTCPHHALGRAHLPLPLIQAKEGKVDALQACQP